MSLPKLRKLYFPGLISLVFLPVMCINYLVNNNAFPRYNAMNVIWLNNVGLVEWQERYQRFPDLLTFRQYKELAISGDVSHDLSAKNTLTALIKRLSVANDTINGIAVSFGNNASYAEVVDLLDVCFQNTHKSFRFQPINNKILMWHINPSASEQIYKPQFSGNDVIYSKPEQPFFSIENFKDVMPIVGKSFLEFWPSVLMFILMLYFTIFKKKRYWNLKSFRVIDH